MDELLKSENLKEAVEALNFEELRDICQQNCRPTRGKIEQLRQSVLQLALITRDRRNSSNSREISRVQFPPPPQNLASTSFEIDVSDLTRLENNLNARSTGNFDRPGTSHSNQDGLLEQTIIDMPITPNNNIISSQTFENNAVSATIVPNV